MNISRQDTDAGPVFYARSDEEGAPATVFVMPASAIADGQPFAAPLTVLVGELDQFADRANAADARLKPDARNESVRKAAAALAAPLQASVGVVRAELSATLAAETYALQPVAGDASLYGEFRSAFRAMSTAEQVRYINAGNVQMTSALMQAGREAFASVPDEVWNSLVDRHMLLAHVHRSGLQASHQLKPSLTDPVAAGPDTDGALAAAQAAVVDHKRRVEAVAVARDALRSLFPVLAVATGLSVGEAYRLLTDGA